KFGHLYDKVRDDKARIIQARRPAEAAGTAAGAQCTGAFRAADQEEIDQWHKADKLKDKVPAVAAAMSSLKGTVYLDVERCVAAGPKLTKLLCDEFLAGTVASCDAPAVVAVDPAAPQPDPAPTVVGDPAPGEPAPNVPIAQPRSLREIEAEMANLRGSLEQYNERIAQIDRECNRQGGRRVAPPVNYRPQGNAGNVPVTTYAPMRNMMIAQPIAVAGQRPECRPSGNGLPDVACASRQLQWDAQNTRAPAAVAPTQPARQQQPDVNRLQDRFQGGWLNSGGLRNR
ncbi:MAG: hypothetical protein AAB425_07045, partial [Bdellovibrionota bacterium]